jgi:hypothetical protein
MMKHASDVMMTDENIKGHFGSVLAPNSLQQKTHQQHHMHHQRA